jgi:protein phosphatase
LITVRTLIFVLLLAALVIGAFAAIRWYDTNSYFVGVKNNELVIYQGRIGGFLWYHPTVVEPTGVTTADVPFSALQQLESGVQETSVAGARNYVANLVSTKGQQGSPATSPASTSTTITRPTTKGT